jgi:hypothetical protein
MEAVSSTKTLVNIYQPVWCNILEDSHFQVMNMAFISDAPDYEIYVITPTHVIRMLLGLLWSSNSVDAIPILENIEIITRIF